METSTDAGGLIEPERILKPCANISGLPAVRCGAIELGLLGIRGENHDDVGPGRGFGRSIDGQAFFLRLGYGGASLLKTDTNGDAAVAKIQRVSMALRAVTDDGDFFALYEREVGGIVVIEICHSFPFQV